MLAQRSALSEDYDDDDELVKRKSALNYIGLGKKSAGLERRRRLLYGDVSRRPQRVSKRGRRIVQRHNDVTATLQ